MIWIRFDFQRFSPFRRCRRSAVRSQDKVQEKSFGEILKSHLAEVNHLQTSADASAQNLASGQDKDIHNTMIAMEKADVAFQLTMQVRNKVLEAYQEIMRMQV